MPAETVFLELAGMVDSDAGIASLSDLRCIDLDSTAITDKAMERLADFRGPKEI